MKTRHKDWAVGRGHGGNTPDLPVIREIQANAQQELLSLAYREKGVRHFKMGKAHIIVSPPQAENCGWHLSISRPDRYPGWDEIAKARYELVARDITMVMILPPPEEFVNIHNYCFHLWEDGKHS